ncbi:MAG: RsmE family RNA methyltransferase [Bdellovibrionota bacterium]
MTQAHAFLCHGYRFEKGVEISESALPKNLERHFKALRIRSGEAVSFLDGEGTITDAVCISVKPFSFEISSVETHPPTTPGLHLVLSPPRRDTLSQTISQATEMGVTRMSFLITDHNDYSQKEREPLVERSQRVLEAAVEQCRAPYLPKLETAWLTLAQTLSAIEGPAFFADEDLSRQGLYGLERVPSALVNAAELTLFVGPEGGWSSAERALISQSPCVHPLGLGPRILKVPTACVAALYQIRILSKGISQ